MHKVPFLRYVIHQTELQTEIGTEKRHTSNPVSRSLTSPQNPNGPVKPTMLMTNTLSRFIEEAKFSKAHRKLIRNDLAANFLTSGNGVVPPA